MQRSNASLKQQIQVNMGKMSTPESKTSDMIEMVRKKIQDKEDIVSNQHQLFFAVKQLEDAGTLADNKIQTESTRHLAHQQVFLLRTLRQQRS